MLAENRKPTPRGNTKEEAVDTELGPTKAGAGEPLPGPIAVLRCELPAPYLPRSFNCTSILYMLTCGRQVWAAVL